MRLSRRRCLTALSLRRFSSPSDISSMEMVEVIRSDDSPREKVLSTAELLELILLHLDQRTLLTAAQGTCRYWKTLIQDSPSLQKYLYFMPDESVSKSWNSLLAEAFPSFFCRDGTSAPGFGRFTFATFDMIQRPDKITAYNRKEASWRRMLVQQPPILDFAYLYVVSSRVVRYSQSIIRPKKVKCPHFHDGIRMGTLYEFVVTRGPLRYERQTFQRVFWVSSESEHYPVWKRNEALDEAFEQATAQFDLVVYQIAARGCVRHKPSVTEEEQMRRLIFPSFAESDQKDYPVTYEAIDVEGDLTQKAQ